ncbi:MAG: hypothetical protein ABS904_00955 [Solibacillus isronensis]
MREYLQILMIFLLVISSLFVFNPEQAKVEANELLSKTMSFNGACVSTDGGIYISTQGTTNIVFSKFNKDVHVGGSYATIPDWIQFDYNGRTLRTEYVLANTWSTNYNITTYDITGGGKTPTNYALSDLSKVNFSSIKVAPVTVSTWVEQYDKYGNSKGGTRYSCTIPTQDMVIREVTQTTTYKPNGTTAPKLYKTPGNQYRTVQSDSRGVFNVTGIDSTYYSTFLIYEYDGQTYLSTGSETGYTSSYSTIYKQNNGTWEYFAYGSNNFLRPAESSAVIFPDASKFSEWLILSSYSKSSHIPNPNTNNIGFNGAGQEYMVTDAYLSGAGQLTSCPQGLELVKGSNPYCKQTVTNNVKQTEYQKPNFVKDVNLSDLIGDMGDYGSTGDNKLNIVGTDSGSHSNGWHLNGAGETYKSNHVQFTNVPDNGYVNALGDSWSPNFLITQGKIKLDVPVKDGSTTAEKQKWDKSLSDYKATGNTTEVISYKVSNMDELKAIQEGDKGLLDLFAKNGSTYKHANNIVSASVTSTGINDISNLKIGQSGYYILASKYVDLASAKKEQSTPSQTTVDKHTYYSFIPVNINFMTDLGYLPIQNNLLAQVNDSMLVTGNKKVNHKLPNLQYGAYKSMKVPSAYNAGTSKTLIGSTTGGLQLTDSKMNPVTITGETALATSAKVSDIVEHSNGFYIATDKGILYLNCEDNSLNKTIITEPVNDILLSHNAMHILTDTTLRVAFVGEGELIMSSKEYDLKELFSDASVKAGRIEEVNGLLNISSKDDGSLSEVITLTK